MLPIGGGKNCRQASVKKVVFKIATVQNEVPSALSAYSNLADVGQQTITKSPDPCWFGAFAFYFK